MAQALDAEGAAWEAGLLRAILAAPNDAALAAAVNEELADIAQALDWGARIPAGAARGSLAGALCAMFVAMAHDGPTTSTILASLAWGGAGALASAAAGRGADRLAKRLREGIDALVERALVAAGSGVDPGRRDV